MQTSVEANEEAAGVVSDMEQLGRRALPIGGLNGPVKYNIVLEVPPGAHPTRFFPGVFGSLSFHVVFSDSKRAYHCCCRALLPLAMARFSFPASVQWRQRGILQATREEGRQGAENATQARQPRQSTTRSIPRGLRKTTGIMADIRGPRRAPGSGRAIANCQVLHEPKNANLMAFDVDFDG